jgi:hypothetical protein
MKLFIALAFSCLLSLVLASKLYAVGLYDANYENNLLKIPLIKVGDVVYEVTMIREESAELARIGCTEFCFRLASAEVARNYSSSIYAFYDASTSTATIDNLWYERRVYKVSLKHLGQLNGGDYFSLVNADQKQGLPVYLTSYENKNNLNIPPQRYPTWDQLDWVGGVYASNLGAGVAFADFFQDGTISMVWFTNRSEYKNGPHKMIAGAIQFFKFDSNGKPVDRTSELLKDTVGCIAPRKLLVADFNGDGKPDIFASCHGAEDIIPFPGENPKLLLSQPNGTYKNITIEELNCYCHTASAADLNGDGTVDILTSDWRVDMEGTDVKNEASTMIALINDGRGGFTIQRSYDKIIQSMPTLLEDGSPAYGWVTKTGAPTMELVDVNSDGKPDLIIASSMEPYIPTRIFLNNNNRFDTVSMWFRTGIKGGLWALDIIVKDGFVYLYGMDNYDISLQDKSSMYVYKYNMKTNTGATIYNSNVARWSQSSSPHDFIWMIPYNGNLFPLDSLHDGVEVPM